MAGAMGHVHPPAISMQDAKVSCCSGWVPLSACAKLGSSRVVIDEGIMDIHWHQDRLRRVIEIRGEVDESFLSHLSRSVVDLGRRDLVIDLSECTISLADYDSLRHLEQRLGSRTLLVLIETENETVEVQETVDSESGIGG